MIIKYFKTESGKVFYKYSLESIENIKKNKKYSNEILYTVSNPELEIEKYEEISSEEYNLINNQILPSYVI